jgi:hypothetical protein
MLDRRPGATRRRLWGRHLRRDVEFGISDGRTDEWTHDGTILDEGGYGAIRCKRGNL